MGAVDKGKLDSKVADDLLMDTSVVQLMENPKVASAITRLGSNRPSTNNLPMAMTSW